MSETALAVLQADAEYISATCIVDPLKESEADALVRRGLIVGCVQSGKTASMLAVTAQCLDAGMDIVVILAGTRTALWRQTTQRVLSQLDGWTPSSDNKRRLARVFIPKPTLVSFDKPDLRELYFETPNLVRRQLNQKRPVVAVVMKQAQHLMSFRSFLQSTVLPTLEGGRKLQLLVIDDEADDGSILDADIEGALAPDSDELKHIPRHIAQIWSGPQGQHQTFHRNLSATYIAYTATPQANLLQSDHNPLAPTDFVAALRVPYESGRQTPREVTYTEPLGLSGYYTGGEIYYQRLGTGPGAVPVSHRFPSRSDYSTDREHERAVEEQYDAILADALRAYFVGAACHLFASRSSVVAARAHPAASLGEIATLIPKPFTALINPSARQDEHFRVADAIALWSAGENRLRQSRSRVPRDESGRPVLSIAGLRGRLENEEQTWRRWIEEYALTRSRVQYFERANLGRPVREEDWDAIRRILIDEVFPQTRLTVINSDPNADDRPRFEPVRVEEDKYLAPTDILTIFVSGNVMSRGITLEGLSTTVFLRSAVQPNADTQMQMQRWFGYRGSQLQWSRVFLYEDQLALFRAYHEADVALRSNIISAMNRHPDLAPDPIVLQGEYFSATGKIANLRSLPLCPGADPFVSLVEHGAFAHSNAEILGKLLDAEEWREVIVGSRSRGLGMVRTLGLEDVADLLDKFKYTTHAPDPNGRDHERWKILQDQLSRPTPLFCPPIAPRHGYMEGTLPPSCPYSIAAYLRFWQSALTKKVRGVYPTDDRRTPWAAIDLKQYQRAVPDFYIGIRFGSQGISNVDCLAKHGVHAMRRATSNGKAIARWGSRNPSGGDDAYLGDQLFDYHIHQRAVRIPPTGEPPWRPRGEPGLLLFHVLRSEDGSAPDAVTVGLVLPLGGPDHFAAMRST